MIFWILAPIMVIAALGILFVRKAVHAALLLAVVMISLAFLYASLNAPFLFAVQIIVYTGAILMLFLFVVMLVGVDASDSVVETIRGQRVLAIIGGLLFGLVLVIGVSQMTLGTVVGLDEANAGGNVEALADILFSRYVFAFETTSALLITAAVGAMVLAHRERLVPKSSQADLANQRVRDYGEHGLHLGPMPAPGVYARHNAVDTPALLPDGTAAESSVSRVLASISAATSAMVGPVKNCRNGIAIPNRCRTVSSSRVARRLSPPSAKKLSLRPTSSTSSSAVQCCASSDSSGPVGAAARVRVAAAVMSPASVRRSTFPLVLSGRSGRTTSSSGSM